MGWQNFFNLKKSNPFMTEDFYDHSDPDLADYSLRDLAGMRDTRELTLGPVRIADGVAITRDGYFSAVLQVGTVNFALATPEEQEAIIGGYHAVLRQLAGSNYQIKVRMVEADLEPLAARVDYALSGYSSAPLHRLALQYKQFLREELPRRLVLMERRNYVIVSLHSPRLLKMAQTFERETGRCAPLLTGLGQQWQAAEGHPTPQGAQADSFTSSGERKNKAGGRPGKREKKVSTAGNPAELRRAQQLRARIEDDMEQKMYEEAGRTLRQLRHQLNILVAGLSSNGLALRRLNDWELIALYAEYLRPELAQEVRRSLSGPAHSQNGRSRPPRSDFVPLTSPGGYGHSVKPLSLSEFMGEQSGTVVVSDQPADKTAFRTGVARTEAAVQSVTAGRGGVADPPNFTSLPTATSSPGTARTVEGAVNSRSEPPPARPPSSHAHAHAHSHLITPPAAAGPTVPPGLSAAEVATASRPLSPEFPVFSPGLLERTEAVQGRPGQIAQGVPQVSKVVKGQSAPRAAAAGPRSGVSGRAPARQVVRASYVPSFRPPATAAPEGSEGPAGRTP